MSVNFDIDQYPGIKELVKKLLGEKIQSIILENNKPVTEYEKELAARGYYLEFPTEPDELYSLGKYFYTQTDFSNQEIVANKLIELNDPRGYILSGMAYYQKDPIEYYNIIFSDFIFGGLLGYFYMGIVHLVKDDYIGAISYFNLAYTNEPNKNYLELLVLSEILYNDHINVNKHLDILNTEYFSELAGDIKKILSDLRTLGEINKNVEKINKIAKPIGWVIKLGFFAGLAYVAHRVFSRQPL